MRTCFVQTKLKNDRPLSFFARLMAFVIAAQHGARKGRHIQIRPAAKLAFPVKVHKTFSGILLPARKSPIMAKRSLWSWGFSATATRPSEMV